MGWMTIAHLPCFDHGTYTFFLPMPVVPQCQVLLWAAFSQAKQSINLGWVNINAIHTVFHFRQHIWYNLYNHYRVTIDSDHEQLLTIDSDHEQLLTIDSDVFRLVLYRLGIISDITKHQVLSCPTLIIPMPGAHRAIGPMSCAAWKDWNH